MIVQLTSGEYPGDEYAIGLDRTLSVQKLAERARARSGTYAYELVETLHWSLFIRALDLKRDYQLYFAREYGSFREYLARRYRYSPELIRALDGLYTVHAIVLHYESPLGILSGNMGLRLLRSLLT